MVQNSFKLVKPRTFHNLTNFDCKDKKKSSDNQANEADKTWTKFEVAVTMRLRRKSASISFRGNPNRTG